MSKMVHRKLGKHSLYLCKEDKTFYVYYYREQSLKKEVPFGSYYSAMSFIENFKVGS
jgi:hypothetical protein